MPPQILAREKTEIIEMSEEELEAVRQRTREAHQKEPRIERGTYEVSTGRIVLELFGGAMEGTQLSFVARRFPGLEGGSDAQLAAFIVAGRGASIRWPELNVGIGAPALVKWTCGMHEETLTRHLRNISKIRTEASRDASRVNGAKGGRPRKNPVAA